MAALLAALYVAPVAPAAHHPRLLPSVNVHTPAVMAPPAAAAPAVAPATKNLFAALPQTPAALVFG